jgi:hypothetical protein
MLTDADLHGLQPAHSRIAKLISLVVLGKALAPGGLHDHGVPEQLKAPEVTLAMTI